MEDSASTGDGGIGCNCASLIHKIVKDSLVALMEIHYCSDEIRYGTAN
jgi:hypothetical protein